MIVKYEVIFYHSWKFQLDTRPGHVKRAERPNVLT